MEISAEALGLFAPAKSFPEYEGAINSLAFHRTEELLVTAGDDDSIHVYNTQSGDRQRVLYSKKYGAHSIAFSHHPTSVIYASSKGQDHSVRFLSLHDNRYLRYFTGHSDLVSSLSTSPLTDLFLSSSADRSVRLWDLRSHLCQGLLRVPAEPIASFDHQGLVFAVASSCGSIRLFDARNFVKGPFASFTVKPEERTASSWSCLQFSRDGKSLLAAVDGRIYVLDSFSGDERLRSAIVHSPHGPSSPAVDASFSPDNQFILSGHEDGSVRFYQADSGALVTSWGLQQQQQQQQQQQPPRSSGAPKACWAPRQMLVAAACESTLSLWTPNLQKSAL